MDQGPKHPKAKGVSQAVASMVPRLLVFFYFAFYMIGLEVAEIIGVTSMRVLGFFPAVLYLVYRVGKITLRSEAVFISRYVWGSKFTWVFIYVGSYCILYLLTRMAGGPLGGEPIFGFSYAGALVVHVAFWYNIPSDPTYLSNNIKLLRDLARGIVFTFVLLCFLPAIAVGKIQPGGLYGIREEVPFFMSTLDTPLIAAIAGIIGWAGVQRSWNAERQSGDQMKSSVIGILVFTMSIFALVLYSRRGPFFGFVIALLSTMGARFLSRLKIEYGIFAIIAVPFVWSYAVDVLIFTTQNELVSSFVARNTAETYKTATGRIEAWSKITDIISNVRIQHLWGYGDSTEILGHGLLSHAHNTYLQLFYETGLMGLLPLLILITSSFAKLNELVNRLKESAEILAVWGTFILLIVVSTVESLMREIFFPHLLVLQLFVVVHHLHYSYSNQNRS